MGLSPTGISASVAAQALSSSPSCRFSPAHSVQPVIRPRTRPAGQQSSHNERFVDSTAVRRLESSQETGYFSGICCIKLQLHMVTAEERNGQSKSDLRLVSSTDFPAPFSRSQATNLEAPIAKGYGFGLARIEIHLGNYPADIVTLDRPTCYFAAACILVRCAVRIPVGITRYPGVVEIGT
jgi:hypothetical protein